MKKLTKKQKNIPTATPYEDLIQEINILKDIPIFKWNQECWKCHMQTSVVSYDLTLGYSFHIGDVLKLDEVLISNYPFVKKVLSKTMDEKVIANTCIHCGALQGNWYVGDDLFDMKSSGNDIAKLIDKRIPNNLEFEDLSINRKELEP